MNFGRYGVLQAEDAVLSPFERIQRKISTTILRILVLVMIAGAVAGTGLLLGAYKGIIADSPHVTDSDISPLGNASFIYDANGDELQKLNSEGGNRISISIDDIPLNMQHAMVAIEDSRFYQHNGVDPRGVLRALYVAVTSRGTRSEGASTITQQLLKNNVFTDWLTEGRLDRIKRKLQEQFLAIELEKALNDSGKDAKAVILENYLNTVNFGSNSYGVQTAAQTYFGKDAKDMTLSECAVLAAIPQNPSRYNPVVYPENNASRMKTVLDYMLQQGFIDQKQHDEALADNVYQRIQEHAGHTGDTTQVYSYFVDAVIDQVRQDLMTEKGYTSSEANNLIYSGGINVYTTEDPEVQAVMEQEFQNEANYPAGTKYDLDWALTVDKADGSRVNYSKEMLASYFLESDPEFSLTFDSESEAQACIDQYKASILAPDDSVFMERTTFTPQPQACMTVIDQATGQVKGIIGGRGQKTASLTMNRATDALRQPGSTFKILSTYGPALDKKLITLSDTFVDEEMTYDNGVEINNYDNAHHGTLTVRRAIETSNNIIAVQVISKLTPRLGFEYLQKLGFSTLIDSSSNGDVNQALALGGITNGVSNLELTAAYAAIANQGYYNRPILYTKVTDRKGNVILSNEDSQPRRVFQESTAFLLTSAMEGVVKSGTGTGFALDGDIPVAGKTGTTNDGKDHLFVGFTPEYTGGIWCGYDSNQEMDYQEYTFIEGLWTNVMNRINEGHAESAAHTSFQQPGSVDKIWICSGTGLRAGYGCPAIEEYFANGTSPTEYCTQHIPAPEPEPEEGEGTEGDGESEDGSQTADGGQAADGSQSTQGGQAADGSGQAAGQTPAADAGQAAQAAPAG